MDKILIDLISEDLDRVCDEAQVSVARCGLAQHHLNEAWEECIADARESRLASRLSKPAWLNLWLTVAERDPILHALLQNEFSYHPNNKE